MQQYSLHCVILLPGAVYSMELDSHAVFADVVANILLLVDGRQIAAGANMNSCYESSLA